MTDVSLKQPGFGSIMATGVTAQVLGGAVAVVFVYYFHQANPTSAPPPEAIEQALGTIFSTVISTAAMIGHILLRKYLSP